MFVGLLRPKYHKLWHLIRPASRKRPLPVHYSILYGKRNKTFGLRLYYNKLVPGLAFVLIITIYLAFQKNQQINICLLSEPLIIFTFITLVSLII